MSNAQQDKSLKRPAISLERFAFFVAGPREFLIAGAINGLIAVWLFGFSRQVPLVGSGGVMSMWIPLSFLLPSLSSFFGVLAGALSRKGGVVFPPLSSEVPWLAFACRVGLIRGCASLILSLVILTLLHRFRVELAWPGTIVVIGVTVASGFFAYVMHSTAILATRKLEGRSMKPTESGN